MLTPTNNASVKPLGDSSEMAKARRVENAIMFWQNQSSFHFSPHKQFEDSINPNMGEYPSEMRQALASGVIHTIRSSVKENKKKQLKKIFSDDSLPTRDLAAESCASISFSSEN
jgi:hypothetical protein